jgi:uncharacterized protein (TIGR02598 family)
MRLPLSTFCASATFRGSAGRRGQVRAFSLVEVVLALGVASFGLISMMGLLCVGVQTEHDAISTTTEAEIAQQLASELQLASYSVVSASPATNYYFTQEGFATNRANAVYFASVSAPTVVTAPGSPNSSANMKKAVISIWSISSPHQTNAIPIEIANNGF